MEEKQKLPALLFDEECPLCVRFKDSLVRASGFENINMVPVQNEEIYQQYPILNKELCLEVVHLLLDENNVLTGHQVIEYLVKLNPTVQKFSWLIESNMGQKAIEYFHHMTDHYRKLAKQRCQTCK